MVSLFDLCREWVTPPPQGFWRLCTTHGQSLAHPPSSTYKGHRQVSPCHKFTHSSISLRNMAENSTPTTNQLLVVKPTKPLSASPRSAMTVSQISPQSTQPRFARDKNYYHESGDITFVVEDTLFKVNTLTLFLKSLNAS